MKTKKELNALTEESKPVNNGMTELSEDVLDQISGGVLTEEAQLWWNRNGREILNRAYQNKPIFHKLSYTLPSLISPDSPQTVSLNLLKTELGKMVDLSGLN